MRGKWYLTIIIIAILLWQPAWGRHAFGGGVPNGRRVVADTAPLRAAIVLSIGENIFKSSEMGSARHPFFTSGLPRGTVREHAALLDLLRQQGVRVLDVRDLLQDAIRRARREGKLADWLLKTFPATADEALKRLADLDADSLLNRRDDHFYAAGREGGFEPLFPGMSSMYWSRDFAVSTPKGIIIGNGQAYGRALENSLARLMFEYADELKDFPVVFDAGKEGVLLDGGDVIVLDAGTLLVGVGNRSSLEAAPKLARKLGLDVLAVSMPPADKPSGLSRQLLHLDSIFNLLDAKKALAVPFFLGWSTTSAGGATRLLMSGASRARCRWRSTPSSARCMSCGGRAPTSCSCARAASSLTSTISTRMRRCAEPESRCSLSPASCFRSETEGRIVC